MASERTRGRPGGRTQTERIPVYLSPDELRALDTLVEDIGGGSRSGALRELLAAQTEGRTITLSPRQREALERVAGPGEPLESVIERVIVVGVAGLLSATRRAAT